MTLFLNFLIKFVSLLTSLVPVPTPTVQNTTNEDVYIPEYLNINPLEGEDFYEPNDNYDDAIRMNPENFYSIESYSSSVNGTLFYTGLSVDYDYYYITIFTDSYVEIDLISLEPNCMFSLVYFDYIINNGENGYSSAQCDPTTIYDDFGQYEFKNYNGVLKPGTYFIYLDNFFNTSNVTEYQLSLDVSKTQDSPDANIDDLIYNKNCKGAIWLNDFLPFVDNELPPFDTKTYYYLRNEQGYHYNDFAIKKFSELVGNSRVKAAVIYIWDMELRRVLADIFLAFYQDMLLQFEEQEKIRADLELAIDITSNIIEITGYINENMPYNKEIQTAVDIGLNVTESAINGYFYALMPKFDMDKTEFFAFVASLASIFDFDDNNETNTRNLRSYNVLEIIEIPIYYVFNTTSDSCNVDFEPTIEEYIDDLNVFYEEDIFYANQCEQDFLRGKIFGLLASDDLSNLDSLTLCSEILKDDIDISLDQEIQIDVLETQEYLWYEFTPLETKRYFFLCYGSEDAMIEIFSEKVSSYMTTGMLAAFQDGYINVNDSSCVGCYGHILLEEGITYFIRVRTATYNKVENLTLVISDEHRTDAVHTHNYCEHIWINSTQHESFCYCGYSTMCGHSKLPNGTKCIVCGGRADMGFIGPIT